METMRRLAWIAALSAVLSGCALPAPRLSEPDNSCGAVVEAVSYTHLTLPTNREV